MGQLLNDLRNTFLGVQILLAGLVTVAFTPAFPNAGGVVVVPLADRPPAPEQGRPTR